MGATIFTYTGALDPEQHAHLHIERSEDQAIRQTLARVGTECVLISLIGARQTGKTSLLNRLHAEYTGSAWLTVQADLSELSEFEGEVWYSQFIAQCCEQLQRGGMSISEADVAATFAQTRVPLYSARGWTETIRLACRRLSGGQRLLISLDEISSVPRQQWEPFFSNIRAVHQSARSPNQRPEYRRLGMILAGAFVPSELINDVKKSPFNVSTNIYMSPVRSEALAPGLQLLVNQGVVVEDRVREAIYDWSGGLLYHFQRLCDKIARSDSTSVTVPIFDTFVQEIIFDDAYLSHILRQLDENRFLAQNARRILREPLRSNRNESYIATLEITGVIRYDPGIARWRIINRLCEYFLRQYFREEEQAMTGLEPIAVAALTKAVDFLFDEAKDLMKERRENRQKLQEKDDTPEPRPDVVVVTKEEVKSWQPKNVYLKDIPKEVEHCLTIIHQYRRNRRIIELRASKSGGIEYASTLDQNQLIDTENNIKEWCQKLKDLVEEVYGHKITIIGLD